MARFHVADLAFVPRLLQLPKLGVEIPSRLMNVLAWSERIKATSFSQTITARIRISLTLPTIACFVILSEERDMADLPSMIPIFPLPNVVLFPQVMLPLHIFEPRYRKMVRDAETQSPPLIGMTLLRGNWQEQYEGMPDVFSVGCAGEMVRVDPLPDGRFNILLQGMRELSHSSKSLSLKGYRQAKVEWRPAAQAKNRSLDDRASVAPVARSAT